MTSFMGIPAVTFWWVATVMIRRGRSRLTFELGGVLVGGPGDDTITGGDDADYLESEGGIDTFFGMGGNDRIFGGDEGDVLDGGDGDDMLYGEGGDDTLLGGEGDDQLFGGQGGNTLDGGPGSNLLFPDALAPSISQVGDVTYTANGSPVLIAPLAVVEDQDSFDFNGGALTVSIVTNGDSGDILAVANQGVGSGQFSIDGANVLFEGQVIGAMTGGTGLSPLSIGFNLNGTIDAVQALARSITFESPGGSPFTAVRSVSVVVDDGDGMQSDPALGSVSVLVFSGFPGDYNLNDSGRRRRLHHVAEHAGPEWSYALQRRGWRRRWRHYAGRLQRVEEPLRRNSAAGSGERGAADVAWSSRPLTGSGAATLAAIEPASVGVAVGQCPLSRHRPLSNQLGTEERLPWQFSILDSLGTTRPFGRGSAQLFQGRRARPRQSITLAG